MPPGPSRLRLTTRQELAETKGFEPLDPLGSHDFQSCRFGRSRTSPCGILRGLPPGAAPATTRAEMNGFRTFSRVRQTRRAGCYLRWFLWGVVVAILKVDVVVSPFEVMLTV